MHEQINENEVEPISKTRKKKEMKALRKMGEQLVGLSERRLKELDLPLRLFDAVLAAKGIHAHGARLRQIKYIGSIIREIDFEPIKEGLSLMDRNLTKKNAEFHRLEQYRDGFISGDATLFTEIFNEYPNTDRQRLKQLARNAIKEKKAEKGVKHSRTLFKYLREISETGI